MAEQKISELEPAGEPLAGTELVPLVQGGETKRASVQEIRGPMQIIVSATAPEDPQLHQLWLDIGG